MDGVVRTAAYNWQDVWTLVVFMVAPARLGVAVIAVLTTKGLIVHVLMDFKEICVKLEQLYHYLETHTSKFHLYGKWN